MHKGEWIAILDFGSQVTQLIARRIREQKVYSEIVRYDVTAEKLRELAPCGIILSGGPATVLDSGSPKSDPKILELGIPVLGICYGQQLCALQLGGTVRRGSRREYGKAMITVHDPCTLFDGLPRDMQVWMSHGDKVDITPPGFIVVASSESCRVAAMVNRERRIFGTQFHPEVIHTPQGGDMLWNFVFKVCKCRGDWEMTRFVEAQVESMRERIGDDHVLCALSGGVDSSVVAALLHRAIGPRLHCVFVDNGLLRYREVEQVEELFGKAFGIDLHVARAADYFLDRLKDITDPETKRKIIGAAFIDIFVEKARELPPIKFLAQGTLYPDVIESISPVGGPSSTIKSHHNVGGLPEVLDFELIEPLRELFKDEVRLMGRELGLPDYVVNRPPFPGPGLSVRIIGEVTRERVAQLQQADLRVREEIMKMPHHHDVWQYFAVLLPVSSVGVMGDDRTYDHTIVVRAVQSLDGMTADWYKLPYEVLEAISNRIINEVPGINRVVYDISSKPPSTIEWE